MLEVDNINTFYSRLHILKDVSLRVADGEVVTIIGPNGHGKSTLLKTICGLLAPKSGNIKFDGKEITGLSHHEVVKTGLVYIAEDRHLFSEMTVLENLKLGAYIRDAWRIADKNLEYVFQLFPMLRNLAKRPASTLSGGQARMLAIGRGLMSSAKFLAIDEPSLGLAPNIVIDVFERIGEIKARGTSILLSEQNVPRTAEFIDRVCLLEDGRLVLEGMKEEVLNNKHVKEIFLGI